MMDVTEFIAQRHIPAAPTDDDAVPPRPHGGDPRCLDCGFVGRV